MPSLVGKTCEREVSDERHLSPLGPAARVHQTCPVSTRVCLLSSSSYSSQTSTMLLLTILATFALLAPLADAGPVASKTIAWNAVSPRSTPTKVHPKKTRPIPLAQFSRLFGFTPKAAKTLKVTSLGARDVAEHMVRGVALDGADGSLEERDILEKRDTPVLTTQESQTAQTAIAANCVGSSANDTYLTSVSPSPAWLPETETLFIQLFYYGGPGVTVCTLPEPPASSHPLSDAGSHRPLPKRGHQPHKRCLHVLGQLSEYHSLLQ